MEGEREREARIGVTIAYYTGDEEGERETERDSKLDGEKGRRLGFSAMPNFLLRCAKTDATLSPDETAKSLRSGWTIFRNNKGVEQYTPRIFRNAGCASRAQRTAINKTTKSTLLLYLPSDNDRSYIPAAMKNGRGCRPVRLEAAPGGFAGEDPGAWWYTRRECEICRNRKACHRLHINEWRTPLGKARGVRFNSGAFSRSLAGRAAC
ncbi:hypothetical protein KM043_016743 [Ampulex compressa]|nr:hypothetical protein KM043_016743 [Ampulex compressa]